MATPTLPDRRPVRPEAPRRRLVDQTLADRLRRRHPLPVLPLPDDPAEPGQEASTAPFYSWLPVATINECLMWAIMALGLNVVVGYAGLLDLGYVAFWALGGYTAGWLMASPFNWEWDFSFCRR